ncbi:MAG: YihY/virulence factor BrkB family protein [Lacunisphaera sp.]
MKKSWLTISLKAAKNWNDDNVFKHSASVSFCTLFSLAPITIVAVTVVGFFFGKQEATNQLSRQVAALVGPASADLISKAAAATESHQDSWFATTIGIILVVVGATTVFAQLQDSLNAIWGVRTRPSKSGWAILILHRLVSFAMVVTVGFLLLVSLVLTTFLTSTLNRFSGTFLDSPAVLQSVDLLGGLVVITSLFALMFKLMPDVILEWKEVALGAAVTAILFTAGRYLIALYLSHSTVASIYGTAGSLVALLMWVYYSCAILFFGVEFIRAHKVLHHHPVRPKKTAVLVREEIVQSLRRG